MVVRRRLARVAERLPAQISDLQPMTDASDAVILHLWQAVQIVIDLAISTCLQWDLGAPATYAEAFRRPAGAGTFDDALATRLARAAGFRNVVAHAYEQLDMTPRLSRRTGWPRDLEAFLAALRDRL